MSKSLWKNKFFVNFFKKTKSRNLVVNKFFLNRIIQIYNGKKFVLTKFNKDLFINMPLGSFSLTRKIGKIHRPKKNKNLKKNKKK